MNKNFLTGNEIENAELKNICERVEGIFLDLGQVSATMSVISKAGYNASYVDSVKLCEDISCALEILIEKVDKHQEELEKIHEKLRDKMINGKL